MTQQPGTTRQLSYAQRLWFLDQLMEGSTDYLLPMALRNRGDLDAEALLRSLEAVVDRHEVLRTHYPALDDEPSPPEYRSTPSPGSGAYAIQLHSQEDAK